MLLRLFARCFFIILAFNGHLILNAALALSEPVLSDSVLLTFSNLSLVTWRAGGTESIMKEVLANMTTDYCEANLEKCGVSSGASFQFKAENVKTADKYLQNKEENLEIVLYIEIPTSGGSTLPRIPGEILLTIINDGNRTLSSEVGHALGPVMSGQTLSRSEESGVDNDLNKIMIPFAFVLLFIIALACWVLHRAKKKRQLCAERRRHTIFMNSKNGSNLGQNFKSGFMANTADGVPPTPTGPERGSTPELDPPTDQAKEEMNINNNNNMRRHKKRPSSPTKQPVRKCSSSAESEDVCDTDNDEREKTGGEGRFSKERRCYDVNKEHESEIKTQPGAHSQARGKEVNGGYQRDSEGECASDLAGNSAADSAVELGSSVTSSANQDQARAQEAV